MMKLHVYKSKVLTFLIASLLGATALAGEPGMTQLQLDIWNSPQFQEQFTLSYLAETEIEPRVTQTELEDMKSIMTMLAAEELDKAIVKLSKIRNEASSAVIDFTLANIYFQQEKYEQALELYEVSVDKFPKFRRAWKNMAMIYVRQADFAKAVPALTKVIELGGNDSLTYGLLGYGYSSLDNNISAESAYRLAILLDPKTFDWKMGLARCFFKQNRYSDAIALCDNLIKGSPENINLWLLQANAYIADNKPLKAAEIFEIVDVMGGSSVDSLNMLGDIYVNQELYELAVKSYVKAIDMEGATPERAVRSAKVLVARGAMEETRGLLDKLDKVFADKLSDVMNKDVLKIRARLAVAAGSAAEEAKVLEEIILVDPLDGEALILLGQNYARSGDTEKAIFYYERAEGIEQYEADAKVRHAQLLIGQGNYNEALPLLKRAQDIKPRENVREYLVQVEKVAKTSK